MENDSKVLELLPTQVELVNLSKQLKIAITSKKELLNRISQLENERLGLVERMIYVLGLISLGFDEERARERLGISTLEFHVWIQDPEHVKLYKQSIARGEMILEETVLSRAEIDPDLALKVLEKKEKKRERIADKQEEKQKSILEIMKERQKERGLAIDGEIVDDILK